MSTSRALARSAGARRGERVCNETQAVAGSARVRESVSKLEQLLSVQVDAWVADIPSSILQMSTHLATNEPDAAHLSLHARGVPASASERARPYTVHLLVPLQLCSAPHCNMCPLCRHYMPRASLTPAAARARTTLRATASRRGTTASRSATSAPRRGTLLGKSEQEHENMLRESVKEAC